MKTATVCLTGCEILFLPTRDNSFFMIRVKHGNPSRRVNRIQLSSSRDFRARASSRLQEKQRANLTQRMSPKIFQLPFPLQPHRRVVGREFFLFQFNSFVV